MDHMNQRQWELAIRKFKAVLPAQNNTDKTVVQTNIGTAYINWGNALFNRQAYGKALDKYEAAFDVLPGEDHDPVIGNIAAAYHNMTIPLLKTHQFDKAVAVLQAGVNRFPYCTPCRNELDDLQLQLKNATVRQ